MNVWPDGRPLSDDDLMAIAETNGAERAKLAEMQAHLHNGALFRTHLKTITQEARLAMFWRSELDLRTPRPRGSTT